MSYYRTEDDRREDCYPGRLAMGNYFFRKRKVIIATAIAMPMAI